MRQNESAKRRTTPEFWLVVIMLFTLTVLVVVILCASFKMPTGTDVPKASEILEYRKSILTIIITAFGAWVGAGAAYFFGRENMRVAAESLLEMHQSSGERFKRMPIRNLPRKPVDWTVKSTDTVANISAKINRKRWWFIPIIKDDGSLDNVIHEDAVWLFINSQSAANVVHADIMKKTIAEVVSYIRNDPALRAEFDEIYVAVTLDDKAGEVHEAMLRKDVYLGIVTGGKGNPTEFFTTADMRLFLLQAP